MRAHMHTCHTDQWLLLGAWGSLSDSEISVPGSCSGARARVLGMRACAHTHVYTNEQVRARVGVCARAIPSVRACVRGASARVRARMRASVRMRVRLGKRCLHSVLVRECIFVPECGAARGCACPFATTHGGQECAHTNNSPVTLQNISIVDVRGGTAIRDDILLTARRTTLDKTFQTLRLYSAYAVAPIDNAFQTP